MVKIKDIESIIDITLKEYKEKCSRSGTTATSGTIHGQGEMPKFDFEELSKKELDTIADTMAERWGLEVSIDKNGKREISKTKFSLWDDEHKTLIRLNKYIKKHPSWVDFTNNGKGQENLDDILRYYDEMPDPMKDATGGILFETNLGSPYNTVYDYKYDIVNPIVLTGTIFTFKTHESSSVQRNMYHEGGHAVSNVLPNDVVDVLRKSAVGNNTYSGLKLSTDKERKLYNDYFKTTKYHYPISNSVQYDNAMKQNDKLFASQYGKNSFYKFPPFRKREEDWAETLSMASFRNSKDKTHAKIMYPDGSIVDYDTFVRDHKATFKMATDFLDGKIGYDDMTRLVTD